MFITKPYAETDLVLQSCTRISEYGVLSAKHDKACVVGWCVVRILQRKPVLIECFAFYIFLLTKRFRSCYLIYLI